MLPDINHYNIENKLKEIIFIHNNGKKIKNKKVRMTEGNKGDNGDLYKDSVRQKIKVKKFHDEEKIVEEHWRRLHEENKISKLSINFINRKKIEKVLFSNMRDNNFMKSKKIIDDNIACNQYPETAKNYENRIKAEQF